VTDLVATLGPLAVVAIAAVVAVLRPGWTFAMVIIAVPLRLPFFPRVELATLILVGVGVGRLRAIVTTLAREPVLTAATLALPAWFLLSALWARQAAFVVPAAGKWLTLWLAFALAASDDTLSPRRIVHAALAAMVPFAAWGFGERVRLITPLGDEQILRNRAIDLVEMIRGRALFWHPNRLAEFTEQIGLLLVGIGLGGIAQSLCGAGVLVAMLGVWGTDSKAGMATMIGGTLVTTAWLRMSTAARRRAALAGAAALVVAALAVATWAFVAHGGIGTRWLVYRYAWGLFVEHPVLGIGGGNWALAIGSAPLGVSRFWFRSHAHSLALQLAVEVGVIGVVLGGVLFLTPLWVAWRRLTSTAPEWRGVVYGAIAAVLGLLAHNLVHYFLRDAADGIATGLLLGLAVMASAQRDADAGAPRARDSFTTPASG
jgi:hypothetical protein